MNRVRMIVLALVATLAVTVPALAASENGITPQAPKKGAAVKEGSRPTFKGKVAGPGSVFVYVDDSRKTNKEGVIGNDAMIQEAKVKGGRFSTKARFYDYDEFWLNTPGTYYWQAHRIACGEDGKDCLQEGPVVKFKVK